MINQFFSMRCVFSFRSIWISAFAGMTASIPSHSRERGLLAVQSAPFCHSREGGNLASVLKHHKIRLHILLTAFLSFSASTFGEEIVTIESTISGNAEQPKVLTIVPWKDPDFPEYLGEEIKGMGEAIDVFQIIDRDTFNRERSYISSARRPQSTK